MLEIMFSWLSIPRTIGIWIDSIAYGLIDNIYNLIDVLASGTLFEENTILTIMNNTYIVISIFALFRIALILVNAMINPDKLTDKENGIGSVLRNLVIMFVLLIFTPMLFREAYYIQKTVVENHYISKIFNGKVESSDNPGKTMQRIALQALIHPDTDVHTPGGTVPEIANFQGGKYVPGNECGGDCEEAINDYNANILTGDQDLWSTFTKHIGKTEKVDGETVYVYTYTFLVTFVVGVFITYVLASMAIDIAVRSVELAVLQIISPLFIVTFIDPKSAKSGPFHNWLKTVGKTYASLFIKLGVLELMLMFINLIPKITLFDDKSGLKFWGTLVVLIAILIFAKKAPKWIGEMIGVDGEDSGIGGLGKKLGSAALVGGALTKAGHAAAGAARGAASLIHRNNQDRRAKKKEARENLGYKRGIGTKARAARRSLYAAHQKDGDPYNGMSKRKALRAMKRDAYRDNNAGKLDSLKQAGAAAFTGALVGGKIGLNASDLKGAFKDAKGAAKSEADFLGLTKKPGTKVGNWFRNIPETVEGAWGDKNELIDRRKKIQDAANARLHSGGRYQAGLGAGNIVEGNGDAVKLFKKYGAAAPGEDILAQYCETKGIINPRGKTSQEIDNNYREDFRKIAETAVKDSNGNISYNINGKTVSLSDLTRDLFVQGTGGVENLGKMFNSYQSNSLSNFSHSQEQYMQQASTYQSILNTQNATAQNAQAIAAALAMSLPDALKDVKIDASSMSGVKNAIKDLNDKFGMASEEEQKILNQKLQELSKLTLDYDESEKQLGVVKGSMDQLKGAIEELKPVVEAIPGGTITEKEQQLSIALSKLDKTIEGLKKQNDEKK